MCRKKRQVLHPRGLPGRLRLEGQLADALRRMAEVASHQSLKNALMHHREETQVQRKRLESILQKHGANPRAHTDQAMQALVNETDKMLAMLKGNDLRDAGLIASAQKLEHYEIAAYGTAAALAGQLDLRDDQRMLHESLEEEKTNRRSADETRQGRGESRRACRMISTVQRV
jgi:ferritin-like metal-binding protein YciE